MRNQIFCLCNHGPDFLTSLMTADKRLSIVTLFNYIALIYIFTSCSSVIYRSDSWFYQLISSYYERTKSCMSVFWLKKQEICCLESDERNQKAYINLYILTNFGQILHEFWCSKVLTQYTFYCAVPRLISVPIWALVTFLNAGSLTNLNATDMDNTWLCYRVNFPSFY